MNTHFSTTKSSITATNGSTLSLSSSKSSKKKFGKNLSKLIKQPSPPQISGLNSKSIYRSSLNTGTSNLVLLSTKKKKNTSNGLLQSSSSAITGGAISGTTANGINSNIVHETEADDNLNDSNSNKIDAWGMDKAKQNQQEEEQNQYQSVAKEKEEKPNDDYININMDSKEHNHNQTLLDKSSSNEEANDNTLDPVKHNQVEFMKQLAKEKSAKIRQEEENRFQQQKERAAMRLKELEMKMAQKSSNNQQEPQRQQQHQLQPRRTLFDPSSSTSRTYSSLVGNGDISASSNSGPGNSLNVSEKDMSKPVVQQHDSHIYQRQHNRPPPSDTPSMPTFHLSSYEDRDRGMIRNLNAGPRMLFDPKSGSMVAAPTKNDITTGNGDRNSSGNDDKERIGSSKGKREKGKQKGGSRNSRRDLDSGGASTVGSDGLEGKGNILKSKNKKDKRKEDKKDSTSSPDIRRRNNTVAADERNGINHIKKVKLPRTNGVLYKRDKNGKLVSADGCEGDQGYGSHSVLGGRIRNPKAYATYKRKLQNESKLFPSYYFDDHGNQGMGTWNQHYDYTGSFMNIDYDSTRTKTLDRSHFMRKNTSSNQPPYLKEEEVNLDLPPPFRVKGDEKLELLTGMDESPTLQATAAEWAPSEAALALAAANARQKSSEIAKQKIDSLTESKAAIGAISLADDGTNDDDHDDEEGTDGLGFDPTKDMDAVMMSPDFFSTDISDSDKDIPDLLFNRISSKNPFASDILLGPSPWGTNRVHNSASMGALSDWAFLIGSGKKDGANNELSENAINDDIMRANSVLSLSGLHGDNNTWGTGGLGTKFNVIDGKSFGNDNTTASPR